MSDPVMKPRYNISLAEERQLALDRLQRICDNGFISVLDFRDNPLRIFAAHELAAIIGLFSSFKFFHDRGMRYPHISQSTSLCTAPDPVHYDTDSIYYHPLNFI